MCSSSPAQLSASSLRPGTRRSLNTAKAFCLCLLVWWVGLVLSRDALQSNVRITGEMQARPDQTEHMPYVMKALTDRHLQIAHHFAGIRPQDARHLAALDNFRLAAVGGKAHRHWVICCILPFCCLSLKLIGGCHVT